MNMFIRKILSFFCTVGKKQNQRSQVAVIIALFIAVIVLLTIVYLNLTKISNIKMLTANAVDKAALGVASRIGSLSHEYKVKLVPGYTPLNNQVCTTNLADILAIILGVLVAILLIFIGPIFMISPIQAILTGIGLSVSLIMSSGIGKVFQEMSARNGMREAAIYQILQTVVSDDAELRANPLGSGIFIDPDTGTTYDLSRIPAMRRQRKANRFQAWYYARRLPLVDDSFLQTHVTNFVSSAGWGMKRFVDYSRPNDYNMTKFRLENLSLTTDIIGLGGNAYEVTCDNSVSCSGITPQPCPSWVLDAANNKLILLRIEGDANTVTDGLFWDNPAGKMRSLFIRLQASYGGWFGLGPALIDPNDFTLLSNDLRHILIRFKEVINIPVNQRLASLQQWFSFFYDEDKHLCDPHNVPAAGAGNLDNYDADIYLRLERSIMLIRDHWIPTLENLNNNNIIDASHVPDPGPSYCRQGRGDANGMLTCYTQTECGCWDDSENCTGDICITPLPEVAFYGIYGTCVGTGLDYTGHPVCQGGDFFAGIPSWCCSLRGTLCITHSDSCSSCAPPTNQVTIGPRPEHYYQGQMAWSNAAGPSEVKQAIQVLYGAIQTMEKMKMSIITLYQYIRQDTPPDPACAPCCPPNPLAIEKEFLRNNAVYAWTDKSNPDGRPRFSHVVSVHVENYPIYLPNFTEEVHWWWVVPQRCITLHNAEGTITFRASRYDQDQPTPWWNLRRRKTPLGAEYPVGSLNAIVADVADGRIDGTAGNVAAIESSYSINSSCQVNYGPDRPDIRIITAN